MGAFKTNTRLCAAMPLRGRVQSPLGALQGFCAVAGRSAYMQGVQGTLQGSIQKGETS
jgi:hypothetical protein